MNLKKNQLLNLPVFTKSGKKLGRIVDFEFNAEMQEIVRYYVKGENIIKELIEKELIIDSGQVVSIDDKKMVVDDLVIKQKEAVAEKAAALSV
ncbi:MAG: PRC-barrel domain-containing protein [Patescibacteria group bacterium]